MAYLRATFKLSKTSQTNVFVEEIKLNSKYSSSFQFLFADRPLKYHPVVSNHLDNLKRNIKSTDNVNIELSESDLTTYYDLNSSKFWFNGRYLNSIECETSTDIPYDLSTDPHSYVEQFNKTYKSLNEVDKVFKFLDLIPAESTDILRLEVR